MAVLEAGHHMISGSMAITLAHDISSRSDAPWSVPYKSDCTGRSHLKVLDMFIDLSREVSTSSMFITLVRVQYPSREFLMHCN